MRLECCCLQNNDESTGEIDNPQYYHPMQNRLPYYSPSDSVFFTPIDIDRNQICTESSSTLVTVSPLHRPVIRNASYDGYGREREVQERSVSINSAGSNASHAHKRNIESDEDSVARLFTNQEIDSIFDRSEDNLLEQHTTEIQSRYSRRPTNDNNYKKELQEMIEDMGQSLRQALTQLALIQGNDERVTNNMLALEERSKKQFDTINDTLQSFKVEIEGLSSKVHHISNNHQRLENTVYSFIKDQHLKKDRFRESPDFAAHNQFMRSKSLDVVWLAANYLAEAGVPGPGVMSISPDGDSGVTGHGWSSGTSPVSSANDHSPINQDSPEQIEKKVNFEDGYCSEESAAEVANRSLLLCDTLKEILQHSVTDSHWFPDNECDIFNKQKVDDLSRSMDATLEAKNDIRKNIIEELVSLEKYYCDVLRRLQENFMQPLYQTTILPYKDLMTMFPAELNRIYEQHCILLHKLESRLLHFDSDTTRLADLWHSLVETQGYLQSLYCNYITALPTVIGLVQKHFGGRNSKACKFLDRYSKLHSVESGHLANIPICATVLMSYIIKPVQHMPQCTLIFLRLEKHTTISHPDLRMIKETIKRLRQFTTQLNNDMQNTVVNIDNHKYNGGGNTTPPVKPKRKKYSRPIRSNSAENCMQRNENVCPVLLAHSATIGHGKGKMMKRTPMETTINVPARSRSGSHNSAAAIIRRVSSRRVKNPSPAAQNQNLLMVVPPDHSQSNSSRESVTQREPTMAGSDVDISLADRIHHDIDDEPVIMLGSALTAFSANMAPAFSEPFISNTQNNNDYMQVDKPLTSTPLSGSNFELPESSQTVLRGMKKPPRRRPSSIASSSALYEISSPSASPRSSQFYTMREDGIQQNKKNFISKNANAVKNSVAAFFSRKKNAKLFHASDGSFHHEREKHLSHAKQPRSSDQRMKISKPINPNHDQRFKKISSPIAAGRTIDLPMDSNANAAKLKLEKNNRRTKTVLPMPGEMDV